MPLTPQIPAPALPQLHAISKLPPIAKLSKIVGILRSSWQPCQLGWHPSPPTTFVPNRKSLLSYLPILLLTLLTLPLHAATPPDQSKPLFQNFLGLCTHTIGFKPTLYAPVCSLARDYHPVEWDLAQDTATLPPFPEAKNRVNWFSIYSAWQAAGYRTDVSLMIDTIPPTKWHNLDTDPFAYGQSFATHFGPSAKLPQNRLVQSVEIGNEPGNFPDPQYTQIFRSLARGLRAADPALKIATCNLTTGPSTKYAKSVTTLQPIPLILYDILTLHTYAQLEGWPTWKRSYPEDPRLNYLKDITKLAAWRGQNAPSKPIWVTEFGYDSTTKSPDPKTEFAKWEGVTDTQQALYLVRSALLFTALPIDRAYIYFFDDNDDPHVHGSSGITRHFQPKPSFYALAHLQKTLHNYRFSTVLEATPTTYAYEFIQDQNPFQKIIVAWTPTDTPATLSLNPILWKITAATTTPLNNDPPSPTPIPPMNAIPLTQTPLFLTLTMITPPG